MGQLLSLPMLLWASGWWCAPPAAIARRRDAAGGAAAPADRRERPAQRRRVHGRRLGHGNTATTGDARSVGRGRRLHHRAGDQPGLRRADRRVVRRGLAERWARRIRSWWWSSAPAAARSSPTPADLAAVAPSSDAVRLHLVETSPRLRARQAGRWRRCGCGRGAWHSRFADVPDGPMILLANEFFDALPIHQYVRREGAWRERLVGLAPWAMASASPMVRSSRLPDAEACGRGRRFWSSVPRGRARGRHRRPRGGARRRGADHRLWTVAARRGDPAGGARPSVRRSAGQSRAWPTLFSR